MIAHEKERPMRRTRVRRRMVAATLTFAALFLAGSHPSWVDAQARAVVVLFSVLEHAEPGFELRELGAFVALDAFVVRALHEAAGGTRGEKRGRE